MAHDRLGLWPRSRLLAFAALAGVVAGVIAVYVRGSFDGNGSELAAAACADALDTAKRVAPLAVGEVAAFRPADRPELLADLSFKAPDGSDTSLAAFAGRTVLLNLWATWCVPCREEMPALDRLQADPGDGDFTVVAVNIDVRDTGNARAFLDEIGVTRLDFYADPTLGIFNGLKRRGLAFGLPTSILIDGRGCRIGSVEGPAAWDSADARALIAAAG